MIGSKLRTWDEAFVEDGRLMTDVLSDLLGPDAIDKDEIELAIDAFDATVSKVPSGFDAFRTGMDGGMEGRGMIEASSDSQGSWKGLPSSRSRSSSVNKQSHGGKEIRRFWRTGTSARLSRQAASLTYRRGYGVFSSELSPGTDSAVHTRRPPVLARPSNRLSTTEAL